jgi:tetratricopeptide (TPR) repeat protein
MFADKLKNSRRSPHAISLALALQISLLFAPSIFAQITPLNSDTSSLSAEDDVAIRTAVGDYINAVARKDSEALTRLWSANSPELAAHLQEIDKIFDTSERIEVKNYSIVSLFKSGDNAVVRIKADIVSDDKTTHDQVPAFNTANRLFVLRRQNNEWKFVRHDSFESYLVDSIAEMKTDSERFAAIDAYNDLNTKVFVRALITKGQKGLIAQDNPDLTVSLFNLALNFSNRSGDLSQLKSIVPNLALAYQYYGDFEKSMTFYRRALDLARESNDKGYESFVWGNIGYLNAELGDTRAMIEATRKNLSYAESVGDKVGIIRALINLGPSYRTLGDYYKAIESQIRAEKLIHDVGQVDPSILKSDMSAALLGNMALTYSKIGDVEMALEYYGKSLRLGEEIGQIDPGVMVNVVNL